MAIYSPIVLYVVIKSLVYSLRTICIHTKIGVVCSVRLGADVFDNILYYCAFLHEDCIFSMFKEYTIEVIAKVSK